MSDDSSAQLKKPKFVPHNKKKQTQRKENSNNDHSVLNYINIKIYVNLSNG